MQRDIEISVGEYYHIFSRGVEKRQIFLNIADHERFLKSLYLANGEQPYVFKLVQGRPLDEIDRGKRKTALGAYSLVQNHFHVLVKEVVEGGISSYMEKLLTGYSSYFNKKYERVGPLFQSRFRAVHVTNDEHLKYLFSYIHLNPLARVEPRWQTQEEADFLQTKQFLETYRYSSYLDYTGLIRQEGLILDRQEFPEYFSKSRSFDSFIEDWLEINSKGGPWNGADDFKGI